MTWVVTVAIPAGIAIYKGYKASGLKGALTAAVDEFKNYDKLMVETEPMDEAQTKLLQSGKVSAAAWKMSDETFERMCEALERRDVLINKDELKDIVRRAEENGNVDYGIIIYPKSQDCEAITTHIYVSYGTPMYCTKEEVEHNASVNHSEIFFIWEYWYLTDLRKTLLLSEIQLGADTDKCVDAAVQKIEEEERRQTEKYTLTCKTHYWVISRGHVIERGAVARGEGREGGEIKTSVTNAEA